MEVINRKGNSKGFGKRVSHPDPIFLEIPLGGNKQIMEFEKLYSAVIICLVSFKFTYFVLLLLFLSLCFLLFR